MLYSKQVQLRDSRTSCARYTILSFAPNVQHCMPAFCFAHRTAGCALATVIPAQASIKCGKFWHTMTTNCRQLAPTAAVPHSFSAKSVQASTRTGAAVAVALDVEYVHMKRPDGVEQSAPAWVALVDDQCHVLLKTYVNPQVPNDASCFGGVSPSAWAAAPSLQAVVEQLQALTAGKLLVGHGLAKDLAGLGMHHPDELMFDTMTHPAFCNKAGNSRSLKQLAKSFLNVNIQQKPRVQQDGRAAKRQQGGRAGRRQQQRMQHDPEEDATAVMRLYQKVVVPSTYQGRVAAATQQLLMEIQQRQQQLQQHEQGEGLDC